MKLVCVECKRERDYGDREIRAVPVERGDAQLFQVRREDGPPEIVIFRCEQCGSIRAGVIGEGASAWSAERLVSVKAFDDPTPGGQIRGRVHMTPTLALEYTDLDEDAQVRLVELLLLCAKKLAAVWRHLQRYGEIEDALIERAQREAALGGRHEYIAHAQDLFIEFDEFLVQLKSSLDYLVKVPSLLLPKGTWTLQTFGDKGEQVIKALQNNVPGPKKRIARGIAAELKKRHEWLHAVIDARDRVNHLIGKPLDPFVVHPVRAEGSAVLQLRRPMWSEDQTIRDSMAVTWRTLLRLFEDFIMMCLFLRFKPGWALFHGDVDPDSALSPWRVTTDDERRRVTSQPGWTPLDSADA